MANVLDAVESSIQMCPYLNVCVRSEAFCHCCCYRECWSWCMHSFFLHELFIQKVFTVHAIFIWAIDHLPFTCFGHCSNSFHPTKIHSHCVFSKCIRCRQPRARPGIAEPNIVCTFFVIDLTACCSCYIFKWSAVLRTQQTGNCSVFIAQTAMLQRSMFIFECSFMFTFCIVRRMLKCWLHHVQL